MSARSLLLPLLLVVACAGADTGPAVLCASASCGSAIAPTPQPQGTPPPEVLAYVYAAIDSMQKYSINKYVLDWGAIRTAARSRSFYTTTIASSYGALIYTLTLLQDRHSRFVSPSAAATTTGGVVDTTTRSPTIYRDIRGQILDEDLAWIQVPKLLDGGTAAQAYADQLQALVQELDVHNPCGWVVDLRENSGGNLWPMLAGIGPVLGEGDIGSFVTPDSERVGWYYDHGETGTSYLGRRSPYAHVTTRYVLRHPYPPVAVLIGPQTASAAEAVAAAFSGRPLTRFIGEPSYGVPTATAPVFLSDGAALVLAGAADADRNGKVFWPSPILPDDRQSFTGVDPEGPNDHAVAAAKGWLSAQTACKN